jgi:ParB family transcriptional regulator, chromosome partitioning protein
MSMLKDQAARAAAVNLDDDLPPVRGAVSADREPKTAPGQLMNLQGKYREALEKIEQLQKGGTAMDLDLSRIVRVPGRQRPLTVEERSELKVNLDKNPLAHPVTVLPETEAGFELLSGYNRVDLYEELGRKTIKAFVIDVDPEKVNALAFYANLLSPSLPDFMKYQGLKQRQEETGFTYEELVEESGMSKSTISRLFQFNDLPSPVLQVLEKNPFVLGATAAVGLAKAAGAGRGDLVLEAVNKLVEAASNKQIKFTEENAVAYANATKPAAAKPQPRPELVVKQGKRNYAKLIVRGDQVTIKFADPAALPDDWAERFKRFIEQEIGKDVA